MHFSSEQWGWWGNESSGKSNISGWSNQWGQSGGLTWQPLTTVMPAIVASPINSPNQRANYSQLLTAQVWGGGGHSPQHPPQTPHTSNFDTLHTIRGHQPLLFVIFYYWMHFCFSWVLVSCAQSEYWVLGLHHCMIQRGVFLHNVF